MWLVGCYSPMQKREKMVPQDFVGGDFAVMVPR